MSKDRRLGRGLAALLGESVPETAQVTARATPKLHQPDAADPQGAANMTDNDAGPRPRSQPTEYRSAADRRGRAPANPTTTVSARMDDADGSQMGGEILMLSVDEIEENPFQPRREFRESEIASLAESIREHDMLQPVLVREIEGRWQLISGERRLRAAISAGWKTIPARVRQASDRLVAELAIVENLQRKDLNAIEKALSFQRYLTEHNSTQEELGKRLKIDRSTIANLVRLLELPDPVQTAIRTGAITAGHAKALLPLGDEQEQISFCARIKEEGLSVRATERLVTECTADDDPSVRMEGPKGKRKDKANSQIVAIERELRRVLGTKVEVTSNARGRGKIAIQFKNTAEFERIFSYLTDDSNAWKAAGT